MAYTDYEGEICAVKYLPEGSVEDEGKLYCGGVGGKKRSMAYILYIKISIYVSEVW